MPVEYPPSQSREVDGSRECRIPRDGADSCEVPGGENGLPAESTGSMQFGGEECRAGLTGSAETAPVAELTEGTLGLLLRRSRGGTGNGREARAVKAEGREKLLEGRSSTFS